MSFHDAGQDGRVRRYKLLFVVGLLSAAVMLSVSLAVLSFLNGHSESSLDDSPTVAVDDGPVEPARAPFLQPGPSRVAIGSMAWGDELLSASKIAHSFLSWRTDDLPAIGIAVQTAAEMGQVAMISWEPRLASKPDPSPTGPDRLVLQRIANGELDGYVADVARLLKSSQQPVILRFAHEMDLPFDNYHSWYGLSPDVYIAAYRHVHHIFQEEKVDNVIWLWSPGGRLDGNGELTSLPWYPGDEYVDMVGLSVFVYWRWEEITSPDRQPTHSYRSPEEAIMPAYKTIVKLNKPVILGEVGADLHPSRKGERSRWLLSLLDLVKREPFDKVVAVVFFNAPHPADDYSADWRLDPAEMDLVINAVRADEFFDAGPQRTDRVLSEKKNMP